jgi:predicted MPP superfamily phosphohydrolase
VPLLENQSVRLTQRGRPFWLIGLGDPRASAPLARGPRRRRSRWSDARNQRRRAILLVHEPYLFPWIPERITLTLSGHMHGGQVNLPICVFFTRRK